MSTQAITELQPINRAFIAYYNDIIYILGGEGTASDLIKFSLDISWKQKNTTTYNFGYQYTPSSIQINDQIWMLPNNQFNDPQSQLFNVFNLNTESIIKTVSFPGSSTQYRCVTKYKQFLLVIGGYANAVNSYLSELNIYSISSKRWISGRNINTGRYGHSCNVIANILYIIGGWDGHYDLDSIEYSSFNQSNGTLIFHEWITMESTLKIPRFYHRSVVFESNIYVIGGNNETSILSSVEIINTLSKTVTNPNTFQLLYEKSYPSVIIINHIIYCFGGYPTTNNDHYQYAVALTYSPTTAPTLSPTIAPTLSPTIAPSAAPTRYPTKENEYNQTLRAIFTIGNLTQHDHTGNNSVELVIIPLIETSYVNIFVGDRHLQYRQFQIIANSFYYNYHHEYSLIINANIKYNSDHVHDD
eukprot:32642_1